ncbi:hypothetical protein BpHYR1_034253 [Brachionus plicatilis]|uniref:Uncharacterized protein n=1 Tax=Brachionus plicatilis TaxID=10195 RepID=A0A3M7RA74_BRAPC|nr:hypothetical protein BpHYR1_034253 [Brachionus plicatilis]
MVQHNRTREYVASRTKKISSFSHWHVAIFNICNHFLLFLPGDFIILDDILYLINNKPFTNRLRSEIMKRFVNDKGQTLGFYEKKFHNEMEKIKKDLFKLVPKNSNFKESWKKAGDSFKNDKNKKK